MIKYFFALMIALAAGGYADNHGDTYNSLIPVGRVVLNPRISNDWGFSLLGEAGYKNYRFNGTVAFNITSDSRIKLSAEYLAQQLRYNFSTGRVAKYMDQWAYGLDYQKFIECGFLKAVDFKAYGSYAKGKTLRPELATPTILIRRRIAGSTACGFALGGVFMSSEDNLLIADVNYDRVSYKRKFHHNKVVQGLGASFDFTHRFSNCIDVGLDAEIRAPFNYYGGRISYRPGSAWNVGGWAGYTQGRRHLPSSTVVGVELGYSFGTLPEVCGCIPLWNPCDINTWASIPAVYMPEVLAIAEEDFEIFCAPVQSSPIPNITLTEGGEFDASIYFSANDQLFFTANGLPVGIGDDPNVVIINPDTGILTALTVEGVGEYEVTVIASNRCSISSQTFILTLSGIE